MREVNARFQHSVKPFDFYRILVYEYGMLLYSKIVRKQFISYVFREDVESSGGAVVVCCWYGD